MMRSIYKWACRFFCIIFLASVICSCSSKVLTATRDTTTQIRTQYVERWRDTTIYVQLPAESVKIETRDTSSLLRTQAAISEAVVSDGILQHTLRSNPDYRPAIESRIIEVETVRDSIVYVDVATPVEVERELTKFQKVRMVSGDIFMCLALAAIGMVLWRLLRK